MMRNGVDSDNAGAVEMKTMWTGVKANIFQKVCHFLREHLIFNHPNMIIELFEGCEITRSCYEGKENKCMKVMHVPAHMVAVHSM